MLEKLKEITKVSVRLQSFFGIYRSKSSLSDKLPVLMADFH